MRTGIQITGVRSSAFTRGELLRNRRLKVGLHTHRARGFTLVELLAVIAIIGILAAIVVPNVARFIYKSRVTKAVAEINNMELALTGALSDTGRTGFRDFLTIGDNGRLRWLDCVSFVIANEAPPAEFCDAFDPLVDLQGTTISDTATAVNAALGFYESFFYEMLRQGKNSVDLQGYTNPEVRQKLGTNYMDVGNDPWGNRYHFWMGPLRGPVPLRAYRLRSSDDPSGNYMDIEDPGFSAMNAYIFDGYQRGVEQAKLPGQPQQDNDAFLTAFSVNAYGYPASRDLAVYIWSSGPNMQNDGHLLIQRDAGAEAASPVFLGGGDDPNSWDNESGWDNAPRS